MKQKRKNQFSLEELRIIDALAESIGIDHPNLFELALRKFKRDPTPPLGYVEDELSYNPTEPTLLTVAPEFRLWALGKTIRDRKMEIGTRLGDEYTRVSVPLAEDEQEKLWVLAETRGIKRDEMLIALINEAKPGKTAKQNKAPAPSSRRQVLQAAQAIVVALEEVVDYAQRVHHNQPPPDLWLDNKAYLKDVEALIAELKTLIGKKTVQRTSRLAKSFDKFLGSYASALGKGAAALTISSMAALLVYLGVGQGTIMTIWGHLKSLK